MRDDRTDGSREIAELNTPYPLRIGRHEMSRVNLPFVMGEAYLDGAALRKSASEMLDAVRAILHLGSNLKRTF